MHSTKKDIHKRLKELGISITAAAQSMGMTRQNFNKHLSKQPISKAFLLQFREIFGVEIKVSNQFSSDNKLLPLISVDVLAGKGRGELIIRENEIESRYLIPEFEKANFLIRVKGSSMYPKYNSGDILACKHVLKTDFIQWNKTYVVDTTQGVLVKRICKGAEKGWWVLRSDNQKYEDIEVNPETDILNIHIVVGVIRLE